MQSNSPRSLATYLLNELMNISAALGALREHDRIHEERLAVAEENIISLRTTIATLKPCSPKGPTCPPTKATKTIPPSTDTSQETDTHQGTVKRMARKLILEWGKDGLIWIGGKAAAWLLPYAVPGALAALAFGKTLLKWLEPLWHAIVG